MENLVTLLIPLLLSLLLIRTMIMPIKLILKLIIHSGCGFLCLWLLGSVSGFTGIYLPVNAVTVAIAGLLGLPGIALVAVLEIAAR